MPPAPSWPVIPKDPSYVPTDNAIARPYVRGRSIIPADARPAKTSASVRRLDAQHRSVLLVRQHIEQFVGSHAHVTDALPEIDE